MLHFAYGSNMCRRLMRPRCPGAFALGPAVLVDHCFFVTADGYASVLPRPRACVHGVLWRLTPRDRAPLDRYESVSTGLYRRAIMPVQFQGRRVAALVYIARARRAGKPKPGYMELILTAAREQHLPADYIASLARWLRCDGIRSRGDKRA